MPSDYIPSSPPNVMRFDGNFANASHDLPFAARLGRSENPIGSGLTHTPKDFVTIVHDCPEMSVQRPSIEGQGRQPPEIIDLTESPPCSPTHKGISATAYNVTSRQDFDEQRDLNFAMALQATLDEQARDQQYVHPSHSSKAHRQASQVSRTIVPDDEFARKLQAQFDAEVIHIPDDADAGCTHGEAAQTVTTQPSSEDVQALQAYADDLSKQSCLHCKEAVVSKAFDLQKIVDRWLEVGESCNYIIECPQCSSLICGGCGGQAAASNKGKHRAVAGELSVCCNRGRLFAIWALLCYGDHHRAHVPRKLKQSYSPPVPRTASTTHHQGQSLTPFPSNESIRTETLTSLKTPIKPPAKYFTAVQDTLSGWTKKQKATVSPLYPAAEAPEGIYPRMLNYIPSDIDYGKAPFRTDLEEPWSIGLAKSARKSHSQEITPTGSKPAYPPETTSTAKGGIKSPILTHSKPNQIHTTAQKIIDLEKSASSGKWVDFDTPSDTSSSDLNTPEIEPEDRSGGSYSKPPKGTGYGRGSTIPSVPSRGPLHVPHSQQPAETRAFAQEQKVADAKAQSIFKALTPLLPDTNNDSEFDTNPPQSLAPMLAQSSLLQKVAELFRNDSLSDATNRNLLYHQVISFVQKLARHYTTSTLLFAERDLRVDQTSLYRMTTEKVIPRCEKTPSIFACGQNLMKQSKAMLVAFWIRQEELAAADIEEMLTLCTHITDLGDLLVATSPITTVQSKTKDHPWKQYQHVLNVSDVNDEDILRDYYFKNAASNYVIGRPGRMKRLVEETVALKTSLPPGIFVRYGTSRLDVIKALIIGPDDTPYEGGIFEFDVICSVEYPQTPPEIHFRTTGGGIAHFNPNLYTCGKVCLSLLNTWSGEQWNPSKSTLLQVLVSLQSMVFCENPWYNEPGRESGGYDNKIIERYNHQIQVLTIKHALMDWLDAKRHSIWDNVILHYIKYNQQKILRTARNWARNNRALTETTLQQLAKEMQQIG